MKKASGYTTWNPDSKKRQGKNKMEDNMMTSPVTLPPGFRFHPTDEELVSYYLKRKINARPIELDIIPEVDLYKCEPWELPGKSILPSKDLEWYFFSPRDRKYPNGSRTNRATKAGYWKATGKDRKVNAQMRSVGMKKTLVYYRGRAPHGARTGWVMHEYRLDDREFETPGSGLQDAYALCRIFKKTIGHKINRTSSDYSSTSTSYDTRDERWTQFSSHEEVFPPYECALMQQYLLPPLEGQDFPQAVAGSSSYNINITGNECLQPFLSVAQCQEVINPLDGFSAYAADDFTFSTSTPWEDIISSSSSRCIEIGEPNEEFVQEGEMIENSRWVGMSYKDLEKSFFEECKNVSIENNNIEEFHGMMEDLHAQGAGHDNVNELDEFPLGFISDEILLEDETFQVVEKVEVYHGMFVSTRQISETFFQQIVPSNTVSVHLNPMIMLTKDYLPLPKLDNQKNVVTLGSYCVVKIKAFFMDTIGVVEPNGDNTLKIEDGDEVSFSENTDRSSRLTSINHGIFLSRIWPFLTIFFALCYKMHCHHT